MDLIGTNRVDKKTHVFTIAPVPRSVLGVLDIAKVADILLLVGTPNQTNDDLSFDSMAKQLVSVLHAQGSPTVMGVLQNLSSVPEKKRNALKASIGKTFAKHFPNAYTRLVVLDSDEVRFPFVLIWPTSSG